MRYKREGEPGQVGQLTHGGTQECSNEMRQNL